MIRRPEDESGPEQSISLTADKAVGFCGGLVALVQFVSDNVISVELASGGNEFDPQRHTFQSQPYQVVTTLVLLSS